MRAAPLATLLLLAGCLRPAEPLLTLGPALCDSRPEFAAATPVPLDKPAGAEAGLGAEGRCIGQPGGARTTYAVFQLPPSPGPYMLEVTSLAGSRTIVRPRATVFDADGKPVRTLGPDEFEPHITGLRAGIRTRGTERWLTVEADRSKLGETLELRLGKAEAPEPAPILLAAAHPVIIYIPPPSVPDIVRRSGGMYSLNGTVRVTATPVQTAR